MTWVRLGPVFAVVVGLLVACTQPEAAEVAVSPSAAGPTGTAADTGPPVPDEPWPDADPARLPEDVPLLEGRVLLVEEEEATGRLSAVIEPDVGRATADHVRQSLLDAGFVLTDEQTDDERPFWWFGVFTSDRWDVTVDVSNETGGGFFARYVITAAP